jgi:hypothetical protein
MPRRQRTYLQRAATTPFFYKLIFALARDGIFIGLEVEAVRSIRSERF